MAETEVTEVIELPERPHVPDVLRLSSEIGMRFSPNDIRELKAETGKRLSELTGEGADEADQMQTMAWLRLRREGQNVRWADCGDIAIEFEVDQEPDPMNVARSTSSPSSASSGE